MIKIISLTKKHKILNNGIKTCMNIILYGAEDLAKEFVMRCDYENDSIDG
jgi:hypothetical protein